MTSVASSHAKHKCKIDRLINLMASVIQVVSRSMAVNLVLVTLTKRSSLMIMLQFGTEGSHHGFLITACLLICYFCHLTLYIAHLLSVFIQLQENIPFQLDSLWNDFFLSINFPNILLEKAANTH